MSDLSKAVEAFRNLEESVELKLVPAKLPNGKTGWKLAGLKPNVQAYAMQLETGIGRKHGVKRTNKTFKFEGVIVVTGGAGKPHNTVFHASADSAYDVSQKKAKAEAFASIEAQLAKAVKYGGWAVGYALGGKREAV